MGQTAQQQLQREDHQIPDDLWSESAEPEAKKMVDSSCVAGEYDLVRIAHEHADTYLGTQSDAAYPHKVLFFDIFSLLPHVLIIGCS